MCGICGIYDYGQRPAVEDQVLGAMMEAIRHGGPDDHSFDGDAALVSRRLSIIDGEGGRQPRARVGDDVPRAPEVGMRVGV